MSYDVARRRAAQVLNDLYLRHRTALLDLANQHTDGSCDADELADEATRRAFRDLPDHLTAEEWAAFRSHYMRRSRRIITSITNAERAGQTEIPSPPPATSARSARRRAEAEARIRSGLPMTAHLTRHGDRWEATIPGLNLPTLRSGSTPEEAQRELMATIERVLGVEPQPDAFTYREVTRDRPSRRL